MHLAEAALQMGDGISHLEALLRRQLVDAVGRVLGPDDLAQYMRWHLARLLKARLYLLDRCLF